MNLVVGVLRVAGIRGYVWSELADDTAERMIYGFTIATDDAISTSNRTARNIAFRVYAKRRKHSNITFTLLYYVRSGDINVYSGAMTVVGIKGYNWSFTASSDERYARYLVLAESVATGNQTGKYSAFSGRGRNDTL